MIKKTLYFGNPTRLSARLNQLVVETRNEGTDDPWTERTIPIEDIGVAVLDHPQLSVTQSAMQQLVDNNCAIVLCDARRHPAGLVMPLSGNTTQTERFTEQIGASEPLKKQLWQQTIQAKIRNQAAILQSTGAPVRNMLHWADEVRSGDTENHEARAAAWYWGHLFTRLPDFRREREGLPPNNLLNYGYAILRATVARSLVASGMLPTLGIHHHNRYNAYCLADDIMEPYRPYVDSIVLAMVNEGIEIDELKKEHKARLLTLPAMDVTIGGQKSPLMIAAQQTTASLYKCFEGSARKIIYPEMD